MLDDGSFARVELSSDASSVLLVRGFGFELPVSARVLGITVEVTRGAGEADAIGDDGVRLVRGGRILEGDRSAREPWDADLVTATYGGADDLWDVAWSASEIADPSFGVALRARPLSLAPAVAAAGTEAQVGSVTVHLRYCE